MMHCVKQRISGVKIKFSEIHVGKRAHIKCMCNHYSPFPPFARNCKKTANVCLIPKLSRPFLQAHVWLPLHKTLLTEEPTITYLEI